MRRVIYADGTNYANVMELFDLINQSKAIDSNKLQVCAASAKSAIVALNPPSFPNSLSLLGFNRQQS